MMLENGKIIIKRFYDDLEEYSLSVAFGRAVRDIPLFAWEKRRRLYEKCVLKYLKEQYKDIILDCKVENGLTLEEPIIWVMWWQGLDKMPPIVSACYKRLVSVSRNKVVLITEDNYHEYLDIPFIIQEKVKKGQITLTHYSDIIRTLLLYKYGGLWVDATMYVDSLPFDMFDYSLYTLHAPGMFPEFINRGNWSTFFLYTNVTNHSFFYLLCKLFEKYWEDHDSLIDYLMIDFFIVLILQHHPDIGRLIENIPLNYSYYDLNLAINETYSYEKSREIIGKSSVQKLTYKKQFIEKDRNANYTNYARIVNGSFGDL